MSNADVRYRAGRSPFVYYSLAVLAILFGLWCIGDGALSLLRADPDPLYRQDPSCDEKLLLDGQEHLGKVCSIVAARTFDHRALEKNSFGFLSTRPKGERGELPLHGSYDTHLKGWGDVKENQVVRLQTYDKGGGAIVVASLYDEGGKQVRLTEDHPATRGESSGHQVKIGLMVIAFAALWIFLGRYMRFSE